MSGICSRHQGHDPQCRLCNLALFQQIDRLTNEVERLKVFEDWDLNYVKCEGCQRYTLPTDMRTNEDDGGCCCLWCEQLDKKTIEVDRLKKIERAASAVLGTIEDAQCLTSSKWRALRDALKEYRDAETV